MYKLVAIDIDGTLLDDQDILTRKVKASLVKAVEKGVLVVLCSGRSPLTLGVVMKEFSFDMPFACFHGGLVIKGKSGDVLFEKPLVKDDVVKIYAEGKKRDTMINIWTIDGTLAVNKMTERTKKYQRKTHYKQDPIIIEDHPEFFDENKIAKMMWYDDVDKIEEYLPQAREFLTGAETSAETSLPYFLEFTNKEANKANAIKHVCDNFGIEHSETIAIGDGLNDLSMVEYASLGVAMGNAHETLKRAADYIAPSNNEDGVAYVLNKFVLGEENE